jgi:ribosomal protein L16/L10AE
LEAARKAIRKVVKKTGFLVIRASAYLPLTTKPSEVRMGKGKGKNF